MTVNDHNSDSSGDECELQDNINSLEELGYKFDEAGKLVNVDDDSPFNFNYYPSNHKENQRRYERLGTLVTEYVQNQLETEHGLERISVPLDSDAQSPHGFIFASPNYKTNDGVLLVLIPGSGAVYAGLWSRSVVINNSLDEGSQLPYIKYAHDKGWSVLVFNPNLNMAENENGALETIPENGTPHEHASYVWNKVVSTLPAKKILIVAHSYGGVLVTSLAETGQETFLSKVRAVAFTDSVHSLVYMRSPQHVVDFFKSGSVINWISSNKKVNEPLSLPHMKFDCEVRSAGTTVHTLTSHSARDSIFEWFEQQINLENGDVNGSQANIKPVEIPVEKSPSGALHATPNKPQTEKVPTPTSAEDIDSIEL